MNTATVARSELILGGQKSGKSRRAETLAAAWLHANPQHQAVLIATAEARDAEMQARIARHQQDRALRVPRLFTVEEPLALAAAIRTHADARTLVVVDCLTLWLTNLLMPASASSHAPIHAPANSPANAPAHSSAHPPANAPAQQAIADLLQAINACPGPLVLVGNEIGLGVIPMGAQVRAFVDALGWLNQDVARVCQRVSFMAAGLPLTLKDLKDLP